jgi:hypothetical protein
LDCACGFRCFVDRYDEAETAALYAGYRDATYFRQRHRHEPWYTQAVNDSLGGPEEVARRNARLSDFLFSCGILPGARRVLDWGGDRGQFIPNDFVERYVYDISGATPVAEVVAVSNARLSNEQYDVVLLAHVLEHAADPIALLREVLRVKATHLYVEVPFEPIRLRPSFNGPTYARWVSKIAESRLYPIVAFLSTASRVTLGVLPPFGVLQQHEHLSFFAEATLIRMLQRVGCSVIATVNYRRNGRSGPIESIGVVAATDPMLSK